MRQLRPVTPRGAFRLALGVHRVDPLAMRDVAPPIGVTLASSPHPCIEAPPQEQLDMTVRAARTQLTARLKAALNHLSGPVEVRLRVVPCNNGTSES